MDNPRETKPRNGGSEALLCMRHSNARKTAWLGLGLKLGLGLRLGLPLGLLGLTLGLALVGLRLGPGPGWIRPTWFKHQLS